MTDITKTNLYKSIAPRLRRQDRREFARMLDMIDWDVVCGFCGESEMLNFKNAWKGLVGTLPEVVEITKEKVIEKEIEIEVVREAIGKSSAVMMYRFVRSTGRMVPDEFRRNAYKAWPNILAPNPRHDWESAVKEEIEAVYAHTCGQAHSEANGGHVQAVACIRVGKSYFVVADAKPIKVLEKPNA